jgi:hypothetical protein
MAAVLTLVLACAPAVAETVRVSDPAGDGQDGRVLDITGMTVDNGDFAVQTRVAFRRVIAPADLYITYWLRGGHGETGGLVLSRLRVGGVTNRFETSDGVIECKRLSADWDAKADIVNISFPSRCLEHGNYGAFRVRVIVEEGSGGSDADLAPKDADGNWRWSRWIARG